MCWVGLVTVSERRSITDKSLANPGNPCFLGSAPRDRLRSNTLRQAQGRMLHERPFRRLPRPALRQAQGASARAEPQKVSGTYAWTGLVLLMPPLVSRS